MNDKEDVNDTQKKLKLIDSKISKIEAKDEANSELRRLTNDKIDRLRENIGELKETVREIQSERKEFEVSISKTQALVKSVQPEALRKDIRRLETVDSLSQGKFDMLQKKFLSFESRFQSFEEKLMMEQDVFKCFVSWHLLDWLYPYIKKSSFLSRLNVEKNIWPFKITGYISNIQRAKKKWYFIEIEDISGKREFFFKDILDFKKFDIVIISWFKQEWRYPRISKLIKTDRQTLIKNAWSSYNPDITVTKAKWMRLWETKIELLQTDDQEKTKKEQEALDNQNSTEQTRKQENNTTTQPDNNDLKSFQIPNNIWDIEIMKTILEKNPWEIQIEIWNTKKTISQEWLNKLKSLL